LEWTGYEQGHFSLAEIIKQYDVKGAVVGIPRRTDGKAGASEDKA
jgi:RNase H-fold protein (predicted Holliday junction resolvase)